MDGTKLRAGISIVANRLWQVACFAVFAPGLLTGDVTDPVAVAQAVGVSTRMSWVVNRLVAEWWLQHTRSKRRPRRPAVRHREPVAASAGSSPTVTVSGSS